MALKSHTRMSTQESEFIKELKLTIMRGLLGFAGLVVVGATAFYFTTTNQLTNHEEKIQLLTNSKADKTVMEAHLNNINGALQRIEGNLNSKNQ